ncbi:MAG: hypothetical protein R3C14_44635 [Caldilineaceae bacterium]
MAIRLLDQLQISNNQRQSGKYQTSEIATWSIPLKEKGGPADGARVILLLESVEMAADAATLNREVRRIIEQQLIRENWEGRSLPQQVVYALQFVNRWLFDRALDAHQIGAMGASVMVATFTSDANGIVGQIFHVGNCRATLMRAGRLYPLTVEHTRGRDYVARTGVTQTGPVAPGARQPTRFLGAASEVELDTFVDVPPPGGGETSRRSTFSLEYSDRVLLCSVGVPPVAEQQILPTIQQQSAQQVARQLVDFRSDFALANTAAVVIARDRALRAWRPSGIVIALLMGILILLGVIWARPTLQPLLIEGWEGVMSALGLNVPIVTPTPISAGASAGAVTPIPTTVATMTSLPTIVEISAPTATVPIVTVPTATVPIVTVPTVTVPSMTATGIASPLPTVPVAPTLTPILTATVVTTSVARSLPGLASITTVTSTITSTVGLSTPAPTPTAIPTPTPTQTPIPVPTATTAPPPSPTATVIPAVNPEPTTWRVTLLEPEPNYSATGRVRFAWSANFTLPAGQAFEVVFWQTGQDPLKDGKGWSGPVTGAQATLNVTGLMPQGDYLWGVRLIVPDPFEAVEMLSGEQVIYVKPPSSGSGPGPTATPARPERVLEREGQNYDDDMAKKP